MVVVIIIGCIVLYLKDAICGAISETEMQNYQIELNKKYNNWD